MKNSFFDGDVLGLMGWTFLSWLMTFVTFGIGYPWGQCMLKRWEAKHTVISSRRLRFVGTGAGLFGIWIFYAILPYLAVGAVLGGVVFALRPFDGKDTAAVWLVIGLLLIAAAAFYMYFVQIQIKKWFVKNTEFAVSLPEDDRFSAAVAPERPGGYAQPASSTSSESPQDGSVLASLQFFIFSVAVAAGGLVAFVLGQALAGAALFGVGIVLLLISYFKQ